MQGRLISTAVNEPAGIPIRAPDDDGAGREAINGQSSCVSAATDPSRGRKRDRPSPSPFSSSITTTPGTPPPDPKTKRPLCSRPCTKPQSNGHQQPVLNVESPVLPLPDQSPATAPLEDPGSSPSTPAEPPRTPDPMGWPPKDTPSTVKHPKSATTGPCAARVAQPQASMAAGAEDATQGGIGSRLQPRRQAKKSGKSDRTEKEVRALQETTRRVVAGLPACDREASDRADAGDEAGDAPGDHGAGDEEHSQDRAPALAFDLGEARSMPVEDMAPTLTTSNRSIVVALPSGLFGLLRVEDAERLQGLPPVSAVPWRYVGDWILHCRISLRAVVPVLCFDPLHGGRPAEALKRYPSALVRAPLFVCELLDESQHESLVEHQRELLTLPLTTVPAGMDRRASGEQGNGPRGGVNERAAVADDRKCRHGGRRQVDRGQADASPQVNRNAPIVRCLCMRLEDLVRSAASSAPTRSERPLLRPMLPSRL